MKVILKILFVSIVFSSRLFMQDIPLPENPLRGQIVFEEKGCIECHAIDRYGGDVGPDLTRSSIYGSFFSLAAAIWNHIPQMDREYRKFGIERPAFSEDELLNLIGFIYYLKYLDEPGSVSKGKKVLENKGCLICHSESKSGAPDFLKVQKYTSPLYMIQTMWNHGPKMLGKIKELGLEYPKLLGKDVVNISAYLRQASLSKTAIRLSPGNPVEGKKIFDKKNCVSCHTLKKNSKSVGHNLREIDFKKSVSEIAGIMWNHSFIMYDLIKKKSLEWPLFKGEEMADLIAYLYFLEFEDISGNPIKGQNVFKEKKCANCHDSKFEVEGTKLTESKEIGSPINILKLIWNHAPRMEDLMLTQNKPWPKLSADDLKNLYAYLKEINTNK